MRKFIVLVAFCFATIALSAQETEPPYIEVKGFASKEIAPDEIYLQIGINEKDYKNKTLADVEKIMINRLAELGIDTKNDLTITDMASNFKSYFLRGNDVKASKEYRLLTNNATTAGKVIMELQKLGISEIAIVEVKNSQKKKYQDEVMVEALQNAKEKAEKMASALGRELGRPIRIIEMNTYTNSSLDGMLRIKGFSTAVSNMEYAAPNVDFEKIEIGYNVSVSFYLK